MNPFQFLVDRFISMAQATALFILLLLFALGAPVYALCTGHVPSSFQIECCVLAIMFLLSFFLAPWYTVVGGIFAGIVFVFALSDPDFYATTVQTGPFIFIFLFFSIGIVWGLLRKANNYANRPPQPSIKDHFDLASKERLRREDLLRRTQEGTLKDAPYQIPGETCVEMVRRVMNNGG